MCERKELEKTVCRFYFKLDTFSSTINIRSFKYVGEIIFEILQVRLLVIF